MGLLMRSNPKRWHTRAGPHPVVSRLGTGAPPLGVQNDPVSSLTPRRTLWFRAFQASWPNPNARACVAWGKGEIFRMNPRPQDTADLRRAGHLAAHVPPMFGFKGLAWDETVTQRPEISPLHVTGSGRMAKLWPRLDERDRTQRRPVAGILWSCVA